GTSDCYNKININKEIFMKNKSKIAIVLCVTVLFLAACGSKSNSNDKLIIYATNFPYESFTKQIGGEYVDVESIYPSGTDLHNYEPTQKIMKKINMTRIYILIHVPIKKRLKLVKIN